MQSGEVDAKDLLRDTLTPAELEMVCAPGAHRVINTLSILEEIIQQVRNFNCAQQRAQVEACRCT